MNQNLSKLKTIMKSPALSLIWRWSAPVRRPLMLISGIAVVSSLVSLGFTLATKGMIDGATAADFSALRNNAVILVALLLVMHFLAVWRDALDLKAATALQKHMQDMVTTSVFGKEYAPLKGYHSGELVNRVFSDVSVVKDGIMDLLPSLLRMTVSFIGAAAILISMDWRFVPALILASLISAVLAFVFREPMKQRHKRMQAAEDTLHAGTQEALENIRVVKASGSEERVLNQIREKRENFAAEQIRKGRLTIFMNQGMSGMFDFTWLLCQLWGCYKIYQGTFTYGSLAAMIQLVGRIQAPIANAVSLISRTYGVVASAERLQEMIGLPDEKTGAVLNTFDEIRLESVCFQYDNSMDDVLVDVTASVHRGDFVALTGISGGGKTSLFQLLLGMYRPTSGTILFRRGDQLVPAGKGTRGLFAYVPQGNTLFSGTLRENLTMFTDHATDEMILAAARAACIDELIDEIGLDAVLGERGLGLSEGQAQRVSLARALISDASILLLDESTSALDEATEAQVLKNIADMRNKTVLIVTHRRAALSICDYILHLEEGRLSKG